MSSGENVSIVSADSVSPELASTTIMHSFTVERFSCPKLQHDHGNVKKQCKDKDMTSALHKVLTKYSTTKVRCICDAQGGQ